MKQEIVTFNPKHIFKFSHKDRNYTIEGKFTTADPMMISKLRSFKVPELKEDIKEAKKVVKEIKKVKKSKKVEA